MLNVVKKQKNVSKHIILLKRCANTTRGFKREESPSETIITGYRTLKFVTTIIQFFTLIL